MEAVNLVSVIYVVHLPHLVSVIHPCPHLVDVPHLVHVTHSCPHLVRVTHSCPHLVGVTHPCPHLVRATHPCPHLVGATPMHDHTMEEASQTTNEMCLDTAYEISNMAHDDAGPSHTFAYGDTSRSPSMRSDGTCPPTCPSTSLLPTTRTSPY